MAARPSLAAVVLLLAVVAGCTLVAKSCGDLSITIPPPRPPRAP